MAGSPLKRARKQGLRLADGSIVAFPYMPRVADLPPGRRYWSPADKIEHLLRVSVDRAAEILCWPITELDPVQMSLWLQVWQVVFMIGTKALLAGQLDREAARERNRATGLEELARQLRPAASRGGSNR